MLGELSQSSLNSTVIQIFIYLEVLYWTATGISYSIQWLHVQNKTS